MVLPMIFIFCLMPVIHLRRYLEDNITGLILNLHIAVIIYRQIERHIGASLINRERITLYRANFSLGRLFIDRFTFCQRDSSGGRSIRHKGYAIVAQRSNTVRLDIIIFHSCVDV